MSSIDLIILGLLLERPMSAYELTRLIHDKNISSFLKISVPAVYKVCRRLRDAGFLQGKEMKEYDQPEKTVYSVDKKGQGRFRELMEHFSSTITPFYLDSNAFLWNIEKMKRADGLRMLSRLRDELRTLQQWIIRHEREESARLTFAGKSIVKQYRMMIATLVQWSEEAVEEYASLA